MTVATATSTERTTGITPDDDPFRETASTSISEPRLLFEVDPQNEGLVNPHRIRVQVPENLRDTYKDVVVENVAADSAEFEAWAKTYLREMFSRSTLEGNDFTWPKFKLPDKYAQLDDDRFFASDGESPRDDIVEYVYKNYLTRTVKEKGNSFMVMHGEVNGRDGFIGGSLVFTSPPNEDESWVASVLIADETNGEANRQKGLGRALLEASTAHFMLTFPDENFNTGVNIKPLDIDGISKHAHELHQALIMGMDIEVLLDRGDEVSEATVMELYDTAREHLIKQGYPEDVVSSEAREELATGIGTDAKLPVAGYTPDAHIARQKILRAVAQAHGTYLSATENIFLRLGGKHLNAITDSAKVRRGPKLPTRRLLLKKHDWVDLAVQRNPELLSMLPVELSDMIDRRRVIID